MTNENNAAQDKLVALVQKLQVKAEQEAQKAKAAKEKNTALQEKGKSKIKDKEPVAKVETIAEEDFFASVLGEPTTNETVKKSKKFHSPKLDKKLISLVVERENEQALSARSHYNSQTPFADLWVDLRLLKNLDANGFEFATRIQHAALEAALTWEKDLLLVSGTGTGKSLAYLLPALQGLLNIPRKRGKQCTLLIIAPTRDLVAQINELASKLIDGLDYKIATFAGDVANQQEQLSIEQVVRIFAQHEIVIATPGRLANILRKEGDLLWGVKYLVLDEVDRLFAMNGCQDLDIILDVANEREGTYLASATIDDTIEKYFHAVAKNEPEVIRLTTIKQESRLSQEYYHCDDIVHKKELLAHLLTKHAEKKALVFVKKIDTVLPLVKTLTAKQMGLKATRITGEMSKEERERALGLFKAGKVNILVTTDLLARGIDIENVGLVINYDLPYDGATFAHRVGRTARFGAKGLAISLVQAHDYPYLGKAMRFMREVIPAKVLPGFVPQTSINPDVLQGKAKTKAKVDKSKLKAKEKKGKAKQNRIKDRKAIQKNKGFPKKFIQKFASEKE